MSYQRKTVDEYEIQGNYGQGFECVTTEATWREAKQQLKCYRENEPYQFRIVKKRVKIVHSLEEALNLSPIQRFKLKESEAI